MFNNPRYLTAGVAAAIPEFLQLFMWYCIDRLPDERDYLQVFQLEPFGRMQQIIDTALTMTEDEIAAQSWSDFVATVTEPELIRYLKERQLYVNDEVETEKEK